MTTSLRYLADVLVSNVDKKMVEGERPVRLCNYTDVYHQDTITVDLDFMEATATAGQIRDFGLRAGDTIITKDSETANDIGVPAFVPTDLPGIVCGYHLALIRPAADRIDPRFLHWVMQSDYARGQLEVNASGVTRFGLTYGAIQGVQVPNDQSLDEQRRIADFLDDQVARIDTVRAHGQDELHLLAEKRLTLVSATVGARVGGEAGALGTGLRPVHGPVLPLRSVASVQSGFTMGSRHEGTGSRFPYMRVANVQDGRLDLTEVKTIELPQSVAARHRLAPGDVLLTEGNGNPANLGRGAVWRGSEEPTLHQNHVFAVRPRAPILDSDYLAFCLESAWGRTYFAATAAQVGIASTSRSKLAALPLVVPGFSAQKQLVRQLEDALAEVARLVHSVETRGQLLEGRKRSLITAAVMGELDVSSASSRAAEAVVGG